MYIDFTKKSSGGKIPALTHCVPWPTCLFYCKNSVKSTVLDCIGCSFQGVNTLSELKLESKPRKQTDFSDMYFFKINTLRKPKLAKRMNIFFCKKNRETHFTVSFCCKSFVKTQFTLAMGLTTNRDFCWPWGWWRTWTWGWPSQCGNIGNSLLAFLTKIRDNIIFTK